VASAGPYANHLHHTPDIQPRQYPSLNFLWAGCSSWRPTNSVKALKAVIMTLNNLQYTVFTFFSNLHSAIQLPYCHFCQWTDLDEFCSHTDKPLARSYRSISVHNHAVALLQTQLLYMYKWINFWHWQIHTHTHTTILLLVWNMSGSTRVSRYQKGKNQEG